jgi:outer membrane protein assembly factor BamA
VRSFVFLTAIVLALGWVAIRHLPRTAEAEVVHVARPHEVQGVAFDGRSLPVGLLRDQLATHPGDVVDFENLARDREALVKVLAARGYLAAQVQPARVVYSDGGAFVTFSIELGPEFRVRSVTVAGAAPLDAGVVTLAAGEIVMTDRISRAREALADRLAARGKPSDVVARLSMDHTSATVDIELVAVR